MRCEPQSRMPENLQPKYSFLIVIETTDSIESVQSELTTHLDSLAQYRAVVRPLEAGESIAGVQESAE
jgi:hypothetical protein